MGEPSRGSRIRERRERLGRSQQELADAVGVSRQQVSNWETGKQSPTGANLVALAAILGVSSEWVLAGDRGGHMVVGDSGDIRYDPNPDPEGTPAEQLMAFLGLRVGMRRLAGELTGRDLVATAYTLARAERFSAEEFKKLDAWRDQIMAAESGGKG